MQPQFSINLIKLNTMYNYVNKRFVQSNLSKVKFVISRYVELFI